MAPKIGEHFGCWGQIETNRDDIVTIGDYCVLAAGAVIVTHCPISFYDGHRVEINIGNNVYIGKNSLVLPGVNIGDNVMIGAGSVVSSDLPSNTICGGNPCRIINTMTEKQAKRMKLLTKQRKAGQGQEPDWSDTCD